MEHTTASERSSFVCNGPEQGRAVLLQQMKPRKEERRCREQKEKDMDDKNNWRQGFRQLSYKRGRAEEVPAQRGESQRRSSLKMAD